MANVLDYGLVMEKTNLKEKMQNILGQVNCKKEYKCNT